MSIKPRNTNLSKSSLIRGIQCSKALYLYKYHYEQRDPVSRQQQDKFDRGHQVGKLAQSLFPGGKDCTPPNHYSYQQSIQATSALISAQYPVIYEAAFKFEGILIALDILVNRDGKWYAYEVKSSLKISQTYLQDISIQYHIIKSCGIELEDVFIVHINSDYVLKGETVNINELFKIVSVKEQVEALQLDIQAAINKARSVLSLHNAPEIETGIQCFKPYPCDFMGTCWKGQEKNPLFQVAGAQLLDKIQWVKSGINDMKDIPQEYLTSSRIKAQVEAHHTQKPFIKKEELKNFMDNIHFPVYCFDIEAFQPAIPVFEETYPFQAIPFQFSLHYSTSEDSSLIETEFISPPHQDGRELFLIHFLNSTEKPGQILVFNTLLEKGILFQLGKLYPQYAKSIKERIQRMVDLEIPFKKDWYYHPKMNGGYSIKNILPTIEQNTLSYDKINIKDGLDAMAIYQKLLREPETHDVQSVLDDLIDYCRMDTLGLYSIFLELKKAVKE
ncbi:MAG: DUF2779 domain-containing protein [Chitinophagales bacterium]|nr:DUF2779 domain-containing protein [Chitinophagales bacterium]MCZ2393779.1 DUF2779 domain-containing protein [Chitinophagales bacterium]